MSTNSEPPDQHDWPTRLGDPRSSSASRYIQQLHGSPGQLPAFIAAPPLPAGSTLEHFRASLYETLCANPELPDSIALPALEAVHEAHSLPLLQPLDPSRRAVDTIPAVLSLQRPAWLQVLLSSRGLKAGARYAPSGGPLRRLKATTLLHAVVLAIALAPGSQQRRVLERSFTQLLLAGADPSVLDSCGLVALEWMMRDALRGQVAGAAERSTKYVSPMVVRQLWQREEGGGWPAAEEALPLLQQPLQQALAAAVRAATREPTPIRRHQMYLALARAGSWEELLQLLPLAGYKDLFALVDLAVHNVVVGHSIAAGSPMPWFQASISRHNAGYLTPELRQRLLAHYCAHPDHVGLYSMLDTTLVDLVEEPRVAALLPRGLRAVLQLAGRGDVAQGSSPGELGHMLKPLMVCISLCARQGQAGPRTVLPASAGQVVRQWVQQGLVEDLKQAAELSGDDIDALWLLQQLVLRGPPEPAAPSALVDCLLECPQQLERFTAAVGTTAEALEQTGPLVNSIATNGLTLTLVIALQLVPPGPRLQQLLAGPLGQQLRRLGSHWQDERLQAGPDMHSLASLLAICTAAAAWQTEQLPADAAIAERIQSTAYVEAGDAGESAAEIHEQAAREAGKAARRRGRLYGRGCDQCGKTGAEVEERGGKLLRCLGCEQVWYCGAECQKKAWGAGHRAECKAAQKAAAADAGAGSSKGAGGSSKGAGGSSKGAGSSGSSKGAGTSMTGAGR